jgi:hypothetical protein
VALAMLAVTYALPSSPASAQGPLVFGIQPSQTSAGSASGKSYFDYTLTAGGNVDDALVISNGGSSELILNLYASDGITSINGSTAFAAQDDVRSDTRSWLSASVSDILVPASQSVTVAFHVGVPADATPGDHVAGWVVQAPPRAGTTGGFGTTVTERAGVAVVVHVPGETVQQLALGEICLNQETGSNYFEVPVRNDGNVLTKAEGSFALVTKDGDDVFTRAAELGNVVPNDSTVLRLDAPEDPGPGEYVANLTMEQSDGSQIAASSDIRIGDKKINGCLVTAEEQQDPQPGIPYLGSLTHGGTPWMILALLFAALLLVVAVREVALRRRPGPVAPGGISVDEDEVT